MLLPLLAQKFTAAFPWLVASCAALALYYPPLFTWFSGLWITLGLGGIMLGMGLTLEWRDFQQVFTTPRWVLVGVALQFSVMPFLGWGLGKLFQLPPFFAVGLILVSCCPGGTASNVISYLAKAQVALSVCMTTISTLLAIALTPVLTAQLSGSSVDVPAWGLFSTALKVVLLPISVGVLLRRFLPQLTQKVMPAAPPFAVLLISLIVGSILGQGKQQVLEAGGALIASLLLLHFFGFLLGYSISQLLFRTTAVSKTIAIEVGMQNSGLGVVLAQENFASPLTAIPAAISSLVHSIYGSVFVALSKRLR
ncbi:MAG: bile acid:sodium symporter family protein [Flavobacteriaceae bacterium]